MAGISGVGVAVVSSGILLAYAGLTNQSPLDVLRGTATGEITPVADVSNASATGVSDIGANATPTMGPVIPGAGINLVSALAAFRGDKYSQPRRWHHGYSDCSSFVGKGFKALGITPPGPSTTLSYSLWRQCVRINRADVKANDLIVVANAHMIVATDNKNGIGQQRPGRNVQTGTIESLMSPHKSFLCLRYVGGK